MDLFVFEPLLTTDGVRPVPGAVVSFFALEDTSFSRPLEVFALDGRSLGVAPKANVHGYINNAGGYKLAVRAAVSKSAGLPGAPVYSVQSILASSDAAVVAAERAAQAAEDAAAGGGGGGGGLALTPDPANPGLYLIGA